MNTLDCQYVVMEPIVLCFFGFLNSTLQFLECFNYSKSLSSAWSSYFSYSLDCEFMSSLFIKSCKKRMATCDLFLFLTIDDIILTHVEINFPLIGNPIKGIKILQIIQTTIKFEFTRHKFHNFVNSNHTRNIILAIQLLLVHT